MIYNSEYLRNKFNLEASDDLSIEMHLNDADEAKKAFKDIRLSVGESLKADKVIFLVANGCSIYAGSKSTLIKSNSIFDEYQFIKNDLVKAYNGDLETKLNSLNILKDYYEVTNRIDELKEITDFIAKEKEFLLGEFVGGLDYSKLNLHQIMLLKLRSFGVLSKTTICTPNYDLAFEHCFDDLQVEYNNGFIGFINRSFNITAFNSLKPNILKVHGSLNWLNQDGRIIENQPHFTNGFIDKTDFDKTIIYPTSEKLFKTYNTPYSELLRLMLDYMKTGKNVIFVLGYKYGDVHINEILKMSLMNPSNIFFFFDYDEDDNNEFIKTIMRLEKSMNNINIFRGKHLSDFRIFCDYVLPANPEKTDEEKLIELLKKDFNHGGN